MNETVFYLCESDKANQNGLVFPQELSKNTYSPGYWFIEIKPEQRKHPKKLIFDAVVEEERKTLTFNRKRGLLYAINTEKYGEVEVVLQRHFERFKKYVGKSNLIDEKSKLFSIVPTDVDKLENLCMEYRFYLIGRIDNQIEE